MKYALAVLTLLCLSVNAFGQKGKKFPLIHGSTLNDKSISVPFNNGKYTVVAIAYHRDAEDDLKKWLNPLFQAFIKAAKDMNNESEKRFRNGTDSGH